MNWFFHLVSDMSGSSKTAGVGMGIPGPIVLKEMSTLPGLNKTGLSKKLHEVFVKERFDLRSEMAVGHELGRQALPVLLNEVLVRAFFFIRRLIDQVKTQGSIQEVDWKQTLPWDNRTIRRMLTIATGTFTAVDLADAAIRAAMKSRGNIAIFGGQLILRVNIVGVGRFTFAVYSDISMGAQRGRLRDERISLLSQQLHWTNAKTAYLQGDTWLAATHTNTALREAEHTMHHAITVSLRAWDEDRAALRRIDSLKTGIERHNPGLIDDITNILT